MNQLKNNINFIVQETLKNVIPSNTVKNALENFTYSKNGKLYVISIGKAAYSMASSCQDILGNNIYKGIIVTKYGHLGKKLDCFECFEAGHPITDINSLNATEKILKLTSNLSPKDCVLFLISGGGSALFETPRIPLESYQDINNSLLKSGADISEINTVRKHLSKVKGGQFAAHIYPAKIHSLILSDVCGDDISTIASGPTYPDPTTKKDVKNILKKYKILDKFPLEQSLVETPKIVINAVHKIIGNVNLLCKESKKACEKLGFNAFIINSQITYDADEFGKALGLFANLVSSNKKIESEHLLHYLRINASLLNEIYSHKKIALIWGGETTVKVTGTGLGGRNTEIVSQAAKYIKNNKKVSIISFGSDGSDGPTDAAGGFAFANSIDLCKKAGIDYCAYLRNNDTYHLLEKIDCLIKTGPTGTNLNDISIILIY